MTSYTGSIISAELTEYKKHIADIINRLKNENSLSWKENFTPEGKLVYVLEFRAPEWFRELDDEVQEVAFDNLKRIMTENTQNVASECYSCSHNHKRSRC